MQEMVGLVTLQEAKRIASSIDSDKRIIVPVHCSMCTNCSGIVGD